MGNIYLACCCDLKNAELEILNIFSLRSRFSSTGIRETALWVSSPCPPSCSTASLRTAGTPPCPGLPSSSLGSRCSSKYRFDSFLDRKRDHLHQRVNNLTTRTVVLSEQPEGADPQHVCRVGQRDQRELSDPRPRRRRQNLAPPPHAQHSRI